MFVYISSCCKINITITITIFQLVISEFLQRWAFATTVVDRSVLIHCWLWQPMYWVCLVFFLKLCCNTFCRAIDVKIFSPTSFAVSTLQLIPALIPVAMLRKLQLSLNEFRDSRNSNSSHKAVMSFTCLAVVKSLCCSLVLYCAPIGCWIALFTSAQTGCAINQTRRWVSVMPRPLVKPPLAFMLRMRTCSMTISGERPTQNRSDLRTTWNPWSKCLDTSGWVSWSLWLCCKYTWMHFVSKLCPEAAK